MEAGDGRGVLASEVSDLGRGGELRVYAHCTPDDAVGTGAPRAGSVTVLMINVSPDQTLLIGNGASAAYQLYLGTSDGLADTQVKINGVVPSVDAAGNAGVIAPLQKSGAFALPPQSYAFAVFGDADLQVCRSHR